MHTVNDNIGNFYFNPSTIPGVQVGDTIHWQWVQGSHTTTSSTIPVGALAWNSPITSSAQVYEYKVNVAGQYNYVCTPHAGMGQVGSFVASAPAPTLSVTPPNHNVDAEAGSTTFNVSSNSNWIASSDQTWCTVTPSGSGNATIIANYTENTTWENRVASITVTVNGIAPVIVTVTQDASTVGINKQELTGVSFYPNPANDMIKLTLPSSGSFEMAIVDLNGRILINRILEGSAFYQVQVSGLLPGLYFTRIRNDSESTVKQLIINR